MYILCTTLTSSLNDILSLKECRLGPKILYKVSYVTPHAKVREMKDFKACNFHIVQGNATIISVNISLVKGLNCEVRLLS